MRGAGSHARTKKQTRRGLHFNTHRAQTQTGPLTFSQKTSIFLLGTWTMHNMLLGPVSDLRRACKGDNLPAEYTTSTPQRLSHPDHNGTNEVFWWVLSCKGVHGLRSEHV